MRVSLLALALPVASGAFQLPFKVPFFNSSGQQQPLRPTNTKPRIAIIGAGAGGSSAAWWISKAKERFGIDVEIDVYDKESYVGGRAQCAFLFSCSTAQATKSAYKGTTVYPYGNTSLPPVELGASIFVKVNKNMWRAVDEFNLTRRDFRENGGGLGIWDGEKLLFTSTGGWWGWWDSAKALLRYGFQSPRRTQAFVDRMTNKFLTLYSAESETPTWDNITHLSSSLSWSDLVSKTTSEYLKSEGVSDKFIAELVEASTRVNYGQNADEIHALEGACSLAPTGASAVEGGNFQIFEQFLNRSSANLYLNTSVTSINPASKGQWVVESARGAETYTAVILAAPYHSTNIEVPAEISAQVPPQPYVHLHVTLFTTTLSSIPPESFSLPASTTIPPMLLTTFEGARNGGKEPEFNSMSYHGLISEGEWVVKIFSKKRISQKWLSKMFDGQVGWIYRKEWDAYPVLPPTSSFPNIKLAPGFYYVNSFEPFISTMETETLASRNIVDLLLNEKFNSGICGPQGTPRNDTKKEDYVYGWDC
ncbi:Prenylcysteine lyase-domain-containing protein [Mycena metata]|uniref:Prenylcysteine lyase-domain-containing protein n=1 Tax=Mycena metata TaxID=1033252 RepID=A0AAD7KHU6_9AGAR|nr:Prenylcysteine lyase-domain-containing protein [Mycena metata]